jgi:hypothetical protein
VRGPSFLGTKKLGLMVRNPSGSNDCKPATSPRRTATNQPHCAGTEAKQTGEATTGTSAITCNMNRLTVNPELSSSNYINSSNNRLTSTPLQTTNSMKVRSILVASHEQQKYHKQVAWMSIFSKRREPKLLRMIFKLVLRL